MNGWNDDPYDSGTPKYSTAVDIYDGLQELSHTEEMGILAEIGMDVSWEQQGYIYFDKGHALLEEFERLSEYGEKLWVIDLAILQIDKGEIHGTVYEALCGDVLAKRTGFKKVFVETVLGGSLSPYKAVTEAWESELAEADYIDYYTMWTTLMDVMRACGFAEDDQAYNRLCNSYRVKLMGLKLEEEARLVSACRAHLTAYDDFLYGLRVNQALHEEQERSYQQRVAQLQAGYQAAIGKLLALAEENGLADALAEEMKMLGSGSI